MSLPFTVDQFLSVFAAYNSSIWPAQIPLNALGVVAIVLCFRQNVPSRLIAGILAALWLWTGVVYHWLFFSSINRAAYIFGGFCVLQALLFMYFGFFRQEPKFGFQRTIRGYAGALFIIYALLIYPILGYFLGHVYPQSPTFGAPCPTTIFTFGLLLWTATRVRWQLLLIPFVWALIGSTAAFTLGIREDLGLLAAGLIAGLLLLF